MRHLTGAALTAIAFASLAAPAYAATGQETPAAGEPDETQSSGGQIEEIVVTAQKREENLQDVPISIAAVSEERLQASGVEDLQRLSTVVPGLGVNFRAGVFQPSIRGISTGSTSTENPAALYIDGVYIQSQREGFRDLIDVEQVAVLKGPQGTLFGRNATAGVIQITTLRPSQQFRFRASTSLDNYATFRANAYMSGGLGTGASASLALSYATQGEGYGEYLVTGEDSARLDHAFNARGQLLLDLGPNTEALLSADYQRRADSYGPNYRPYPGTVSPLAFGNCVLTRNVYDTCAGVESLNEFNGGGGSATLRHDFGFAELTSITAYREGEGRGRFDAGGVQGLVSLDAVSVINRNFSQELQLTSGGGGGFSWTAGLFYFQAKNANNPLNRRFAGSLAPLPTSAALTETVASETTESFAAFAQADINLTDRTTLTLGGRWTWEERDYEGRVSTTRVNGTFVPNSTVAAGTVSVREPTWRISLLHEFSPTVRGFVSYNRGFKSGGFNIVAVGSRPYEPEILDAFEVGVKSELFGRRVRFNTGAFWYEYRNLQVTQYISGIQSISNAAQARIYGIEADVQAIVTDALQITGGFSLIHPELTSYPGAVFGVPRTDANGNLIGGNLIVPGDATGNQIPQAQEFTASLAVDYEMEFTFGKIRLNGTASHSSGFFFEADNFMEQSAYTLVNSSIAWSPPGDHYTLELWVRNILDENVATHAYTQSFGSMITYGQPPRTFGVTARVRW